MLFFGILGFGFLNVFHSLLARCEDPRLVIFPSKGALHTPAGKPFGLLCEAEAQKGAFTNMEWINSRGEIIPKGTPGVKEYGLNSLKLSFLNPKAEDSGIYKCTALYGSTKTLEVNINVTFYDDIQFENCESVQNLVVGREGFIRCRAFGNPQPDIHWEKNRQQLRSERVAVTPAGLEISPVTEEDGGLYTVEAFVRTTGASKHKSITVNVLSNPRIIELPEEFVVVEGEKYTIICRADGAEPLTYSWFDPQMQDLSGVEGFEVESGFLTIIRAERAAGGEYKCKVSNPVGEDEAVFRLEVQVRPNIVHFENLTREEGSSVEMECRAEGIPRPELSIRKDNSLQPLQDGQDIELEEAEEGDVSILLLRFSALRRSDDGLYFCKASNAAGDAETAGHLEVQFGPDMILTPTTQVKVRRPNPANLSCVAEANPTATLSWKFQNEPIEPTDERYEIHGHFSYGNLLVYTDENTEYEIFGMYTCEARNAIGENSINILLEEATAPGIITQIVFYKVTPTTVTFRLLGPQDTGGLPITHYVMKYKNANYPDQAAILIEWPKDSPYVVSELEPRARYRFSVAARNQAGEGPWKSANYVMPEEATPEPPTIIAKQEELSDFPHRFL
ncbi:unnamed protein product [Larinioides sclopetarius]|uniref:Uncharacterized protein n=2 Tax=Larinioides sclopetarius TaxID=280406 RepID=A0AAV2C1D3_9ARAC